MFVCARSDRARCQRSDLIYHLFICQRQPVVISGVILVVGALTLFALCLTYDTQIFYTPANFIRDHHAVPVRPVYGRTRIAREPYVKRVLLVPYHRGGSSFLGEIFGENPNAFYWYEPLRNMYREFPARLRTHIDVVEQFYDVTADGNLTILPRHLLDLIINTVHATLTCDIKKMDKHVLREEFMLRWVHMPRVRAYSECMILNIDNVFGSQICAEILRLTCLQSDAIVVKTLRFPVYVILELLDLEPDVKVIYYVRDPRAVLMSRADRFGQTQPEMAQKAKLFCQQLLEDYKYYIATKEKYPNNIMLIKYEDFAFKPNEIAKFIYQYANMTFPDSIAGWILKNTRATAADGRIGTVRNSTATANRWRTLMKENILQEITANCRQVLIIHGYT